VEEKYFPVEINRDQTLEAICEAATTVLSIPTGSATMQSWELPCLFNGSGAGKTFVNFFVVHLLRSYLTRHPVKYSKPILSRELANSH
jgi:hypothetical protein